MGRGRGWNKGGVAQNRRVSDEAVLAAYAEHKSVHKAGRALGIRGGSIHERLVRLGAIRVHETEWTRDEEDRLRCEYATARMTGTIPALAASLGRPVRGIYVRASRLGLGDSRAPRPRRAKWKYMSEAVARALFEKFKRVRRGSVESWCRARGLDDLGFSRTMRQFFADEWDVLIEFRQPKQTPYRLGRAFEYRVRDALRALGYFVLRSPQSKSPIDLVAIRRAAVLFVQCKLHGSLGVEDWNTLYELATSVGAVPLLAETPKRGGILYWRLLEPKDGNNRPQPRGAYLPEHA